MDVEKIISGQISIEKVLAQNLGYRELSKISDAIYIAAQRAYWDFGKDVSDEIMKKCSAIEEQLNKMEPEF